MFLRHNITSGADKLEALRKTAEHLAAQPKKKQNGEVVEMPKGEAVSSRKRGQKTDSPSKAPEHSPSDRLISLKEIDSAG